MEMSQIMTLIKHLNESRCYHSCSQMCRIFGLYLKMFPVDVCCVQSVPRGTMDQAAFCFVPATLMPDVTHRLDTAYALLAKQAITVQHVSTGTVFLIIF